MGETRKQNERKQEKKKNLWFIHGVLWYHSHFMVCQERLWQRRRWSNSWPLSLSQLGNKSVTVTREFYCRSNLVVVAARKWGCGSDADYLKHLTWFVSLSQLGTIWISGEECLCYRSIFSPRWFIFSWSLVLWPDELASSRVKFSSSIGRMVSSIFQGSNFRLCLVCTWT